MNGSICILATPGHVASIAEIEVIALIAVPWAADEGVASVTAISHSCTAALPSNGWFQFQFILLSTNKTVGLAEKHQKKNVKEKYQAETLGIPSPHCTDGIEGILAEHRWKHLVQIGQLLPLIVPAGRHCLVHEKLVLAPNVPEKCTDMHTMWYKL